MSRLPRLVAEGGFRLDAPADDHAHFTLATMTDAQSGTWQATVDWTYATNTLWMYAANGTCTAEQFALPECPFEASCPCQFVVRSETTAPKPRVLTRFGSLAGAPSAFSSEGGRALVGTKSLSAFRRRTN